MVRNNLYYWTNRGPDRDLGCSTARYSIYCRKATNGLLFLLFIEDLQAGVLNLY